MVAEQLCGAPQMGFRACSFLLVPALAACQQETDANVSRGQPLVAVTAPAETSSAALTAGRFALAGRCLVLKTPDGRVFLPVFGRRVTIAERGAPAVAGPMGEPAILLEQVYSVTGSPFPEGTVPRNLPDDVISQCPYPPFAVGSLRKGEPMPPSTPPR